jgi:hypothetical protein
MTDGIKAAAENLAAAKLASEAGMADFSAASSEVDKVRARIAEFDSERAKVVAERKAGKTSPKHGPRLSEIEADQEGLREILTEKTQAQMVAGAEVQRLSQAVSAAQYGLALASDKELLADMVQVAGDLDLRLVETLRQIVAVGKRLGMNLAPWYPTPELANGLRRLDLERGGLGR